MNRTVSSQFSFENYNRLAPYILCVIAALIPWWSMEAPGSYISRSFAPSGGDSGFLAGAWEYASMPGGGLTLVGLIVVLMFTAYTLWRVLNPDLALISPGAWGGVMIFFLTCGLGLVGTVNRQFSLEAFSILLVGLMIFILAGTYFRHDRYYPALVFTLTLSACGLALYGIYQSLYGSREMLALITANPEMIKGEIGKRVIGRILENRASATFGNPNHFGAFLVMIIPVTVSALGRSWYEYDWNKPFRYMALGLSGLLVVVLARLFGTLAFVRNNPDIAVKDSGPLAVYIGLILVLFILSLAVQKFELQKVLRWFYILVLAFQAIALVLTFSRGAVFSLVLAVVICVFFMPKRLRKTVLTGAAIGLLIAVILFGAGMFMKPDDSGQVSVNLKDRGNLTNTAGHRLDYWKTAGKVWRDAPFLGHGLGSLAVKFPLYKEPGGEETKYAHNIIIQLGAECGIVGVIGLLIFGALFYNTVFERRERLFGTKTEILHWGLFTGVTAFMINNLGEFSFHMGQTQLLFWMLAGVSVPALAPAGREIPRLTPEKPVLVQFKVTILLFLTAMIAAIVFVRPFIAHYYFNEAEQMLQKGQTAAAIDRLESARALNPLHATYLEYLGGVYESKGSEYYSRAENMYTEAARLDPEAAYRYADLARLYHRQGRLDLAVSYWHDALNRYPTKQIYVESLALELAGLAANELDPVKAEAYRAEALKLAKDDKTLLTKVQTIIK